MNPSPRKISVVIPLHNAQEYIRETIESVLSQKGCQLEILVVDDGSTDNSPSVVNSFGDQVKYVLQENAGPAVARNRGVEEAQYDWIAFLDSDDLWHPDKLSQQIKTAEELDAGVVYTNARNFGDLSHVGELRSPVDSMPTRDVFEDLLMDNFVTMSGTLVRKSLILAVGGFRSQFRGTEDWDLWLRIAATGANFIPIAEPLTLYRWRSDSLSKHFVQMKRLRDLTLEAAIQSPRGQQLPFRIRASAKANVSATSAWAVEQVDAGQATTWYAQALFRAPWRMIHWVSMCQHLARPLVNAIWAGANGSGSVASAKTAGTSIRPLDHSAPGKHGLSSFSPGQAGGGDLDSATPSKPQPQTQSAVKPRSPLRASSLGQ